MKWARCPVFYKNGAAIRHAYCGLCLKLICIYNLLMVTYDEVKRHANIKKHGFDFLGSDAVFEGFTITREDARDAYGELRLQTLGLWDGLVVFVVHTTRGEADHVISIRKAAKHEERIYWKNFPD